MKYLLLPAVLALSIMGCDQQAMDAAWGRYDYVNQMMAEKLVKRDALPPGDPARLKLEAEIQGHRDTIERLVFLALDGGITLTTPDGTLTAKRVGGEIRITLTNAAPVASIGALAPSRATTRPEGRP